MQTKNKQGQGRQNPALQYRKKRQQQWDKACHHINRDSRWGDYYHERLLQIYRFLIEPNQKILEVGCSSGNLLAGLSPSVGVGIDFSGKILGTASKFHQTIQFIQCDAHHISLKTTFDVIILSDLVNDLWDVQKVLSEIYRLCAPHTVIILNFYNKLWELPLLVAQWLDLTNKKLPQNWLTVKDISGLLNLSGFEPVRSWNEILCPLTVPFISNLCNRYLVKTWPFRHAALSNIFIARRRIAPQEAGNCQPLVSVIVPARNEEGNIDNIFNRTPEMGSGTELVFVEGHSQDNTYATIERIKNKYPQKRCLVMQQKGRGKGDAVRLGFSKASGEILMILDADLTVPPEDLPRFYDALQTGLGQFINGVRLVYPMEKMAMRPLNFLGNKFFSFAFSWLLGQPIKDTLCGTKVLWKSDYERISNGRSYFGDFDPFGDFDLLFGAAKLNLKLVEIPIRYAERKYGDTNISRWKHGWLLLKMVIFAIKRIKCV